jgi:hypothetical protein
MHTAAPELLRALEAVGVKTIGLKVRQSESSR